jgi:ABC-type Fe3+/spermidine/putrescine transport system ATPase subunit
MVFQQFNLFPHLTVLENITLAPRQVRRWPKQKSRQKAMELLERVRIPEQAHKYPLQLSGGQQQRVALARVLVMEPKALLLDEPLGDLDRLLRLRMRVELRALQRQLGLMFIHVTHDQEESLSVGDRIVVMHEGRIEQVADPYAISTKPENVQVASFMGDNNVFHGTVTSLEGGRLVLETEDVAISAPAPQDGLEVGGTAAVSVRAAAVHVDADAAAPGERNQITCSIDVVEYLGDLVKLHVSAGGKRLLAKVAGERYLEFRGREGSTVRLSWKEEDVQPLRS